MSEARPPALAIVVGMRAEARIIERAAGRGGVGSWPRVACSGGDAVRAALLAAGLVEAGAAALASFGIAGGLDAALPSGALILADRVVLPDGAVIDTDSVWRKQLGDRLGARVAVIAASERIVATPAEKAALRARTGAVAVDMESGAVARVARDAGLPFIVVRAVADPAGMALPAAALVGLAPDGAARPLRAAGAVLRRPPELGAMLRLAAATGAALASLRSVARGAGADLGLALGGLGRVG